MIKRYSFFKHLILTFLILIKTKSFILIEIGPMRLA